MSNNNTNDKVLVLRTCAADMSAHGGFIWPKTGFIEAPDWKPIAEYGNGLHGLLWGEGNAAYLSRNPAANWLVCSVEKDSIIDLGGKVKFPKAEVVFCGNRVDAIRYLLANGGAGHAVVYKNISDGDDSTLTGGDYSALTGGTDSTLTGGFCSTLTGGDGSTLTGGNRSTLTGGDDSTLTGGTDSTLTGGNRSTLTGGDYSTLTGGDRSALTGGNGSTLTGGDRSTLTGGYSSTFKAGVRSAFLAKSWNVGRNRYHIAYVGEDDIKPGIRYHLNEDNEFEEVTLLDGEVVF